MKSLRCRERLESAGSSDDEVHHAHDEEEPDYDEEAQIWAAAMEHAAEVEDEETPDKCDWQISRLVSAATYIAGPDAGRVLTGRMKVT